jgi:hypothetical protein
MWSHGVHENIVLHIIDLKNNKPYDWLKLEEMRAAIQNAPSGDTGNTGHKT